MKEVSDQRLQDILESLDIKLDVEKLEPQTLGEAIEEGKMIHRNFPHMDTETNQIKYAIARFLWVKFRGVSLEIEAVERLRDITR